jgi:hypothetical protein
VSASVSQTVDLLTIDRYRSSRVPLPGALVLFNVDRAVHALIPAQEGVVALGRDRLAALGLHDARVSRHHAEARWEHGAWAVRDLGSRNGTAVEGTSALIILTPIFVPILTKLGIDPVHFGVVLVANLTIAGITPPVGQLMFISSQVLKVPMDDYTVEVIPFLGAMLVVLVLLSVFPQLVLWLPNLVYGQ